MSKFLLSFTPSPCSLYSIAPSRYTFPSFHLPLLPYSLFIHLNPIIEEISTQHILLTLNLASTLAFQLIYPTPNTKAHNNPFQSSSYLPIFVPSILKIKPLHTPSTKVVSNLHPKLHSHFPSNSQVSEHPHYSLRPPIHRPNSSQNIKTHIHPLIHLLTIIHTTHNKKRHIPHPNQSNQTPPLKILLTTYKSL